MSEILKMIGLGLLILFDAVVVVGMAYLMYKLLFFNAMCTKKDEE